MASKLLHRTNQYSRAVVLDKLTNAPVARLSDQVAGFDLARNIKKYASFQAQGVPLTYLQGGANQMTYIINGEMGQITKAWIQFTVVVANAPVQLLPAFMWIDRLQSFKDSTNSKGMDSSWVNILLAMGNLTPPQFNAMARSMLCDPDDAWTVEPLQVGTYNVFVPLYDSCLLTDSNLHFYPKNINLTITSPPLGCVESGVPSNVTVTSSSILLEETQVPMDNAMIISNSHKYAVQRIFLDWQILPAQQVTVSASSNGSPINIILTGLEGVTPFLVYGLRSVADNTPTNGAIKRYVDLGSSTSSAKVSLLTPSGAPIFNQPLDPYLQGLITSESTYGSILDGPWGNLYFLEYTKDRIASFNGCLGAGWRKAENNEILQITPGPYVAEVPRVVTMTAVDAAGTVTAATGGTYQIQYVDGYGATFASVPIAYNASQATIQSAIRDMQIRGGAVVSVGATNVNVVAGLTLTVTRMQDYDTSVQGARWLFVASSLRSAAGALYPSVADNGGVTQVGIAPGTYTPVVYFPKFVFLTINPDRSTSIRDVRAESIMDGSLA